MPLREKQLLWLAADATEATDLERALDAASVRCEVLVFEAATSPRALRGRAAVYCACDDRRSARAAALQWLAARNDGTDFPSEEDRELALLTSGMGNLRLRSGAGLLTVRAALLLGAFTSLVSMVARGVNAPLALAGLCVLGFVALRNLRSFAARPDPMREIGIAGETAHTALVRGQSDSAMAWAMHLIDLLPREVCWYEYLNGCVEVYIQVGRYREALELPMHWSPTAQRAGRLLDESNWALVEINLAEAEYNLGRLDDAWRRVCNVEQADLDHSIVRNGALVQKAWVETLRERPAEALQLLDRVQLEGLPALYRAEVFYTRAAAHCSAADFDAARGQAEAGLSVVRRASSERNGLFLLGTIAFRAGKLEEADANFARGAGHPYRYQGGDALLTWGDTLRALGRTDDARGAYELVVERDGQSAAAKSARERLRQLQRSAR